ncbi:MAG TPA: YihY/virulence factor BrkB family protein [Xanthobacteraceae bacterium]|jgi:membrane protein
MQEAEKGEDWRAHVGERTDAALSVDLRRAREPGRGREAKTPEQIPARGWRDIFWRVLSSISADRILSTSGGVAFFTLLAIFPGIAATVSLYGLFADASTIGNHLIILSGILPAGVLSLIADQITFVAQQGNGTLGAAFLMGLLIALISANSAIAALFDALNVVYDEREKRSLLRFYATTFAFTIVGIIMAILAISGVVVLPVALKFLGLASATERLIAIARWPVLFVTVVVSLAFIYRYGPSRRDARWRWVNWGSILAAVLWLAASMLFSSYVATFDSYNRAYGSLGAAVGFMVWLWISAVIILLGGELNAETEHQTARDTTEGQAKPLGARGAMMADHVGKSEHDA